MGNLQAKQGARKLRSTHLSSGNTSRGSGTDESRSKHFGTRAGEAETSPASRREGKEISGEPRTDVESSEVENNRRTVSAQNSAADITSENPRSEEMTSRRWNYSVTTMNAETDGNSTSAYEPGAGNVSAVADDDAAISPNTDETTSIASEPAGCPVPCNGQDQYGNGWTGCPGSYVTRPCPNRALGEAKWFCDSYGNSFVGSVPDYGNCTHMWIEEAEEEVSNLNVSSGKTKCAEVTLTK